MSHCQFSQWAQLATPVEVTSPLEKRASTQRPLQRARAAGIGARRRPQSLRLGAARGVLLPASAPGGLELAVRADALYARIVSAASENDAGRLAQAQGDTGRIRVMLQGVRTFSLGGQRTLTPTLEAGLRSDTGDAETGTGVEIGGGVAFSDPARGIRVDVKARGLVAHQDIEYREWGASVAIRFDPGTAGRGLMLALTPSWGRAASSAPGLWTQRGLRESGGLGYQDPAGRLGAELSYAADGPQGRGTQTPYAALTLENARSRTLRIGWRWTVSLNGNLNIEGTRQNTVMGTNAEYGASLRAAMRW